MSTEVEFIRAMLAARTQRGWSQKELERRLAEQGTPIHNLVLLNLEKAVKTGEPHRRLRLDEAVAISSAFGLRLSQMVETFCENCTGNPPDGFMCNECGAL